VFQVAQRRNLCNLPPSWKRPCSLFFDVLHFAFDLHIAKLTGFEDLPALFAFDVFGIFIARDDAHSRMAADGIHRFLYGGAD
jgi:hypothetical protein